MKKQIPNCITLLNLLCGCFSIYSALSLENLKYAAIFILLGAVFDLFDGMVARMLNVQSPIGKELDSLADMVTFGVAPGFIAFSLIDYTALSYIAFLIPLLSAYRLANFNIDERQKSSFIGLPTPANALIWVSVAFLASGYYLKFPLGQSFYTEIADLLLHQGVLLSLIIIFSILMVSNIPLFSFKFKNLKWEDNKVQYIFLIVVLGFILLMNTVSALFIIILYITLSIAANTLSSRKKDA